MGNKGPKMVIKKDGKYLTDIKWRLHFSPASHLWLPEGKQDWSVVSKCPPNIFVIDARYPKYGLWLTHNIIENVCLKPTIRNPLVCCCLCQISAANSKIQDCKLDIKPALVSNLLDGSISSYCQDNSNPWPTIGIQIPCHYTALL